MAESIGPITLIRERTPGSDLRDHLHAGSGEDEVPEAGERKEQLIVLKLLLS